MEKLQDNPIKEVIALAEKNFDMQELLKLRDIISVLDILVEYGIEINNENILLNDTIGKVLIKIPILKVYLPIIRLVV